MENKLRKFAFYGTLRQGQGNHRWSVAQDPGAKFDGRVTIPGYRMYSLGGYPFVTPSTDPEDTIVVELYELADNSIATSIHRMEIGAGYHVEDIQVNGETYTIYVQTDRNADRYERVPNGDWVDFVDKRREATRRRFQEL